MKQSADATPIGYHDNTAVAPGLEAAVRLTTPAVQYPNPSHDLRGPLLVTVRIIS